MAEIKKPEASSNWTDDKLSGQTNTLSVLSLISEIMSRKQTQSQESYLFQTSNLKLPLNCSVNSLNANIGDQKFHYLA